MGVIEDDFSLLRWSVSIFILEKASGISKRLKADGFSYQIWHVSWKPQFYDCERLAIFFDYWSVLGFQAIHLFSFLQKLKITTNLHIISYLSIPNPPKLRTENTSNYISSLKKTPRLWLQVLLRQAFPKADAAGFGRTLLPGALDGGTWHSDSVSWQNSTSS